MISHIPSAGLFKTRKAACDVISTVLVPVYQDAAFLDIFLKSLDQTIEVPTQVILVDDGCGPAARDLMAGWQAQADSRVQADILRNDAPLGAGASLNAAMERARAETVFILDSDLILQLGWQAPLLGHLERLNGAAAVAGVLLYPQTGGINHCGISVYSDVARHLFLNARPTDAPREPYSVQLMSIAFTALRRSCWLKVGGMNERFFNGYEDLDLFMRMRQAGDCLYVAPDAAAYHWERSNGPHRAAGRKGNLARFWSTWGTMLDDDLWRFLLPKLMQVLHDSSQQTFVGLDLCQDRSAARMFWRDLQRHMESPPTYIRDLSHRVGDDGPIWLPIVAGTESDRDPGRYIMLTDNFVRLRGNRYWITQRRAVRDDDIAIDLHGNVIALSVLDGSTWPGEKVR